VLNDILLKKIVGHAERLGLRIEAALFQVAAVAATEVADGADWFCKDLKLV
jgi:hypothetical protein